MALKRRNVEILSVNLNFTEDSIYSFSDVLSQANARNYFCKEKEFTFKLLNTEKSGCILGIMETIQNSDIPPKANRRTRRMDPVNVDTNTEGLAYANIFLYDTIRNVLIYEINRNGCYPNQLKDYLGHFWNIEEDKPKINITFPVIFKQNEYQRMLDMTRYKKMSIELYNPTELMRCYEEESDSIYNNIVKHNIDTGVQSNANSIVIQQIALRPRVNPMGLSRSMVKGITDSILDKIFGGGQRVNVQEMRVEGFLTDPEGNETTKQIDLIGDSFKEFFKITEIKVQRDLQIGERKIGIEGLYSEILPELRAIRGV